ncbi:hypothetical protein [Jatrophihabitans lederbergiae]|uniref:Resolvase/invertase-type recombinase catalytic domain-containing protein n=1 Tax=Jatrophihabitans lederbergiae TaxID=3075547 RepID=A0ABU2JE97_9ACTN|nr:hypothetical protein [Jatrophihabitans sp. DSM 44399]MDT0263307.1 hypothetical protein [Jatrophihabitans sp. DSM 44399]
MTVVVGHLRVSTKKQADSGAGLAVQGARSRLRPSTVAQSLLQLIQTLACVIVCGSLGHALQCLRVGRHIQVIWLPSLDPVV